MDHSRARQTLWTPDPAARHTSRLGRFLDRIEGSHGVRFADHEAAWRWSIEHLEAFWESIVDEFEIRFDHQPTAVLASHDMPGARWFPGATLNYAAHVLAMPGVDPDDVAVWSLSQSRDPVELTLGELRRAVAACQAGLRRCGVKPGDRVAAYLPNIAETMIAMLASASLGAVWASCAPEFGARSVLDRFSQIEPTILFVVDGYFYGDKAVDRAAEVAEIRAGLPSVQHTVLVPYLDGEADRVPGAVAWDDLVADGSAEPEFDAVAFDHPLYVLFSSGTTGLPKAIVHGHGGITLEHAKQHGLYGDLGPGDRFFWFSTTGWMVWNSLVSGPLVGASVVLFDGNPAHPGIDGLWR
ncbi:MAG: acetoacetyl-CoA synthase, partial [Acidimicrobiales bacterium]|nr:acetoacetyl-CoA synthase [Acidimicrobiales bacterium]